MNDSLPTFRSLEDAAVAAYDAFCSGPHMFHPPHWSLLNESERDRWRDVARALLGDRIDEPLDPIDADFRAEIAAADVKCREKCNLGVDWSTATDERMTAYDEAYKKKCARREAANPSKEA